MECLLLSQLEIKNWYECLQIVQINLYHAAGEYEAGKVNKNFKEIEIMVENYVSKQVRVC